MSRRPDLQHPEEVSELFDSLAPRIESFRRKNRYYYRLLAEMIGAHVLPGSRVLDLGCGHGELLAALKPETGVGIDISPVQVERARQRHPLLTFHVGDIQEMAPVEGGPFDYIVLSNTIGFLGDIQTAFRRIRRCSAPHTRLIITHYNYLWEPVLKLAEKLGLKVPEPYQNWLSFADLENILALEGFQVVHEEQSVLLPKYVPLVSSLCNHVLARFPGIRRLGLVEFVVARPLPVPPPAEPMSCSVIVPARNERGTIEQIVKRVPAMGSWTELIFVEGHSEDGTYEEIERVIAAYPVKRIRLLKQQGKGKADAVRAGFVAAEGDILMILDADMTVLPEELPKFYEAVAGGIGELVMGSRLVYQMQEDSMRLLNLLGNKFFSQAFTFLLGQRIKDTLCGTKVIRRRDYQRLDYYRAQLRSVDPFGDFELIFGAALGNLKIVEVPVRYHARQYGTTQISRFRHGLLLLRMLFWAIRHIKLRYP
ncbi:MAG TPA: glycosyltransferase [Geobacteraceae bacterium]